MRNTKSTANQTRHIEHCEAVCERKCRWVCRGEALPAVGLCLRKPRASRVVQLFETYCEIMYTPLVVYAARYADDLLAALLGTYLGKSPRASILALASLRAHVCILVSGLLYIKTAATAIVPNIPQ